MTNLDSILKSRDITLSAKVHIVKYMVFPMSKRLLILWLQSPSAVILESKKIVPLSEHSLALPFFRTGMKTDLF